MDAPSTGAQKDSDAGHFDFKQLFSKDFDKYMKRSKLFKDVYGCKKQRLLEKQVGGKK